MKLSEIVREVISTGRAANQARIADGAEDDSPMVTSGGDTATMKTRTAEERRLCEFLESQPPSVVYMLIAIMYLGRGDFDTQDLLDQYADMKEAFGSPKGAARQMLVTLPLPEYLEAGLKRLAHAGMDVDKLLT